MTSQNQVKSNCEVRANFSQLGIFTIKKMKIKKPS